MKDDYLHYLSLPYSSGPARLCLLQVSFESINTPQPSTCGELKPEQNANGKIT